MFSFCYFYILFLENIVTFIVSLCKEVAGFLPALTCKVLTLRKSANATMTFHI